MLKNRALYWVFLLKPLCTRLVAHFRGMLNYTASEKAEKKPRIPIKSVLIPSPTSPPNLPLSWTAKQYFILREPTQSRSSHLVDSIFQEGWQRSNYLSNNYVLHMSLFRARPVLELTSLNMLVPGSVYLQVT